MAASPSELNPGHESVLTANVRQARIARAMPSARRRRRRDNQRSPRPPSFAFVSGVLGKGEGGGVLHLAALTRAAREPIPPPRSRQRPPLVANFLRVLNHNNRLDLIAGRPRTAA